MIYVYDYDEVETREAKKNQKSITDSDYGLYFLYDGSLATLEEDEKEIERMCQLLRENKVDRSLLIECTYFQSRRPSK